MLKGRRSIANYMSFLKHITSLWVLLALAMPGFSAISLNTTTIPAATQGVAYSTTLAAIGGTTPYFYQVTGGVLPSGMSLSQQGVLSGTAATAGNYSFTIRISDSSAPTQMADFPLVLVVNNSNGLQILTSSLPPGQVGLGYTASLAASGGTPGYVWDLLPASGNLPNGLTIASNGTILGTPNLAGDYNFIVRVTDSNGLGTTAIANFTLRVNSNVLNIATTSLPNGSLGAFYSQALNITGGVQPYSISINSGSLPLGLSFSSGGVISGTPTALGTANFTVRVTDAINNQALRSLAITIGPTVFAINQAPLPTGQVGSAYSATVTAVGGTSPYTFTLLAGLLPSGISFNNGVFSGTPTVSGNFPITIQATDSVNATTSANFSLVINSTTLILSNSGLPNAILNQAYNTSITASGGQAAYTFSLVAGALPPGIALASNGTLSGTPTQSGTYQFTVRVTDSLGAVTQSAFSLTVNSSSLAFVSTSLANGKVNQTYSANLSASGGTAPYLYTVIAGALPPGLTLGANGLISGTPTQSGTYQITFRVTDTFQNAAQQTITLVVDAFGFRITTPFLSSGRIGQPYSASIAAEGGATPYVFFLLSGQLPQGLNLNFNGLLAGTPTQSGNFSFTVRTLDSASNAAERNYSLAINASAVSITSSTLPNANLNQVYTASLTGTGGTGPYTFTATSGGFPPGITLNSNGTFSGTPTASGTFNFVIQVTDSTSTSSLFNLSIQVNASALAITTNTLPAGVVGTQYSALLSSSGGTTPYSYTLNGGSLPNGLTLSTSGQITGAPTVNGVFNFTVRVTDALSSTATANLTIEVSGVATLTITTTVLPGAQINTPYSGSVSVAGGVLPYSFSIIGGTLPPGLTLLANGGISGTPTAGGNYSFILRVTDGFGSATQASLSINVNTSGVTISTQNLPNGQLGQFYSTQLAASGGTGPYSWSVSSGNLPSGVSLTASGLLSGLPTTGGGFQVTIRVADVTGASTQKLFTFAIGSTVLGFLTTSLPQAYINQQYSAQLEVSGGAAPYSFSILAGSLPTGLTLGSNGLIAGTPATTSFNSITFRVTDATQATAQVSLNLAVGQSTLQFSTTTIPSAAINQVYNTALQATGGVPPFVFTITSGSIPPGMQLSEAGVLSGTTAIAGIYSFTVRVRDSANASVQQSLQLNVLNSSLQITTTSLPGGRVNQPYLQTIQTAGGVLPIRLEVVGTIVAGFPPPGLTLSLGGTLQGTPTTAGTYTFTVRATDSQNLITQATYTLVIGPPAPAITNTTLPGGTAGQTYNQNLTASGGTAPYTFSLVTGIIPNGLTLSPSGLISGTPNTPGTYTITVRVTDNAQQSSDSTFSIVIATGATPLSISALAPPPGTLYFPYNFTLTATGGREPYTWSIPVGPLPNGLRLDANGALNGLLLSPGNYRFTARVTDASGGAAETTLAINVNGATSLVAGQVGAAYNGQIAPPTTGRAPFTFSVNANALGSLPEGLVLSSDGRLSGTPSNAGDYTFGLLIRDASGFATNAAVSITIAPAAGLRILTTSLPGGATGSPYNQTLTASGGRAPYNWVVVSGNVPNGLNLNPLSGQLLGTPSLQGTGFFVVRVSDAAGSTATRSFGVSIGAAGSPVLNAITSAASYGTNGVAPGELLTLFGGTLGPQTLVSFSLVNNTVPTLLSGTRVLFDGVAAPLIYTQAGQASVIAPFSLEGRSSTRIVVEYLGFQSTPFVLPVVASKPGLFTVDGSGEGPGAILNENSSVNTNANRAARESVVVLYLTGAGAMTPTGLEGRVAGGVSSLNLPITVTVNGAPATVIYAGNAPGLVEGVVQVNIKLPLNTVSGPNSIAIQVGPNATTSNVTVFVQ